MHIYFAEIKDSSSATEPIKFLKIKAASLALAVDIAEGCKQANETVTEVHTRAEFKATYPTHHKALWHTPAVTASDDDDSMDLDNEPQPVSTETETSNN